MLWIALQKLGVPDDLITLIKSFHQDMKCRLRVDGDLLEEIEEANGLRQGCTMAPTLFNLYACVVAEQWMDRIKTIEGVGTLVVNKQDGQLFRMSTRNASETLLYKGEFADDVVLFASSREAACAAIEAYIEVTISLGLRVNFPKTKFIKVIGDAVSVDDQHSALEQSAQATDTVSGQPFLCSVCNRTFCRSGNLK